MSDLDQDGDSCFQRESRSKYRESELILKKEESKQSDFDAPIEQFDIENFDEEELE